MMKPRSNHAVLQKRLQNLSKRLPKPAQACGRVQRAVRRCLLVNDGVCNTSEALSWAYSRQLLMEGSKRKNDYNGTVRDALEAIGAKGLDGPRDGEGHTCGS